MKRMLIVWMSTILLITGCQRNQPTATDLMAKLLSMQDTPSMTVYFEGAMPEDEGYLSAIEEMKLYEGHSAASLADEYAIALCTDDRIYEIHIFHSLDMEKSEQIEGVLRRRQILLQKQENYLYDPQSPGAGAIIWRQGKWVCLLVTTDNDSAKEILLNAL